MNKKMQKPQRQVLTKFLLLLMLMVSYFAYLSYEYDLLTGGIAALLTWSFFVLCTPIADAGFLLDFPLRLLFGIRMIWSEMAVWGIASVINIMSLSFASTDKKLVSDSYLRLGDCFFALSRQSKSSQHSIAG